MWRAKFKQFVSLYQNPKNANANRYTPPGHPAGGVLLLTNRVQLEHGLFYSPEVKHKGGLMRSAVMDIETTDLSGVGGGILLCVCVRPLATQRTRVFHIGQYQYEPSSDFGVFERQEKDLLTEVSGELEKYDLLIGHNIDKFDIDFLRTRAYRLKIAWGHQHFTYDTMRAFGRTG